MGPYEQRGRKEIERLQEEYREKHPEPVEVEEDHTKYEREVDDWLSRFD